MVGTPVEEASSSFCMLANSCGRGKDTDISVDRGCVCFWRLFLLHRKHCAADHPTLRLSCLEIDHCLVVQMLGIEQPYASINKS